MRIKSWERGAITLLFAAVLLPLLLFFLILSLDMSEFYAERTSMQRLVDEAALYGYRFLPLIERSRDAVDEYLKGIHGVHGTFESVIHSDSIEIIFHGNAPFRFAHFVNRDLGIPYEIYSRATSAPIHGAIVIDSSDNLGPGDDHELWGTEPQWPSANLFLHFSPFGREISPRFATQQCHNPLFTGLKRAALGLFDYLSSFESNAIGIAFSPGTLGPVDVIREARSGVRLSPPLAKDYFNTASSAFAQNGFCLALSAEEGSESVYRLPDTLFSTVSYTPEFQLADRENYRISDAECENLSAREAIWSRAIRPGVPSIRAAMSTIADMVWSAKGSAPEDQTSALSLHARKIGVIFATDLPREGNQRFPDEHVAAAIRLGLRKLAAPLEGGVVRTNTVISLYYVILSSPKIFVNEQDVRHFQSFLNEIRDEFSRPENIHIQVVLSADVDGLVRGVIRDIGILHRSAVLDG